MKIVIIGAVWCPSCLIMRPRFEELKKKYSQLSFVHYDMDLDEESKVYNVGNLLPAFILIDKENNEIERLIGEHKIEELAKIIDQYMI